MWDQAAATLAAGLSLSEEPKRGQVRKAVLISAGLEWNRTDVSQTRITTIAVLLEGCYTSCCVSAGTLLLWEGLLVYWDKNRCL